MLGYLEMLKADGLVVVVVVVSCEVWLWLWTEIVRFARKSRQWTNANGVKEKLEVVRGCKA